jgi:glycosyltransferase involved in cell wall biosynthesis
LGPIALLYDDDAFVETLQRPSSPATDAPLGLMGRQVAGRAFLDAYLTHGIAPELVAVVRHRASSETLSRFFESQPSRHREPRLRLVNIRDFHESFAGLNASPLHFPCPPDAKMAWARQRMGDASFAISGVTHTLCSANVLESLCSLVTAPFEPYDALICTSTAVIQMVRAVTDNYAEYLRDRHGGTPGLRLRLEHIPLGVDPNAYRPPTPQERADCRKAFGIGEEEVVVLFVGRLSHHSKAHPFPMFQGVGQAARATGRAVHLLLSGWSPHPAVRQAFEDGAREFAPGVRVTFVDGVAPENRLNVWRCADVFTSLSDNIQETFGLVVIEAMSCGLPVVASDWDGYRDLVDDGITGLLVPTMMLKESTAGLTSRLLAGEFGYDHFLAATSQAITVDPGAAATAYTRLIGDAGLRRAMGYTSRRVALARFAWPRIIQAYDALWQSQESERLGHLVLGVPRARPFSAPALYPDLETSFAGYPSVWLSEHALVVANGSNESLERFLMMPLTHHVPEHRVTDPGMLRALLAEALAPCTISHLDATFHGLGISHGMGRATLAWMIKYGLLTAINYAKGERPTQ